MQLPLTDWQFWVTTVVAIIALAFISRTILPRRNKPKRTELTVHGKKL